MARPYMIDRATFEKLQQQDSKGTSTSKQIRNPKYKKVHAKSADFNLLEYLLQKPIKTSTSRQHTRKKVIGTLTKQGITKRRGKTREIINKKPTRLKRTILQHRQNKYKIDETTEHLQSLTLQETKPNDRKKIVHSRNFRDYCDNFTTARLRENTEKLLRELDRFEKRALSINEIKARAHRRFVIGFREAQNYLNIHKCKMVIIATDCEKCNAAGGLDATIESIKKQCQKDEVPYAFSLRRRQLSYTLIKNATISCVAILDYDGAREIFSELMDELQKAKNSYAETKSQTGV